MEWLAFAWLGVIAFTFLLYVVLDGFTLGVGMFLPWLTRSERDLAVSAILPTWDGNQTWFVFSLAALYGMFPLAFAAILPKIYLPAIFLAIMLVFRGICFEFRLKSKKGIDAWDKLFALSSFFIALIHGYLVGQIVLGYSNLSQGMFFKLVTAFALVFGYGLLGTTRLMLKSNDRLFDKAKHASHQLRGILIIALVCVVMLSAWYGDFTHISIIKGWLISILLTIAGLLFLSFSKPLNAATHWQAYWYVVSIFILIFTSLMIYIFPYVVPYSMTYQQAAAAPMTLLFTLIPAVIMIPLLLVYTGYAYYIFRGKTTTKLHY